MRARAETLVPDASGMRRPVDAPLLLHAHDWLAHFRRARPSSTGSNSRLLPPFTPQNMGATTWHPYGPVQEYINSVEWELAERSLARDCLHRLHAPRVRTRFAHALGQNGRDLQRRGRRQVPPARTSRPPTESRIPRPLRRAGREDYSSLSGRMVREKGVQILIESPAQSALGLPRCQASYLRRRASRPPRQPCGLL